MALKQKKSRTLRKTSGSSRYWNLANLRRQWKKKQARTKNRRNSGFYNLQLVCQHAEDTVTTDMTRESA